MPFEPGHKLSPGRQKGSKNNRGSLVRAQIESELGKSLPQAILDLSNYDPELDDKTLAKKKYQVARLENMMPYCYPKLQSTEVTLDDERGESASKAEIDSLRQDILKVASLPK